MKNIRDCRVSSVLNKDVKMYGKKYLFDDSEETCWSSDQGSPQWVEVVFKEDCTVSSVTIQFQGGFVGRNCRLDIQKSDCGEVSVPFYPEDINTHQKFLIEPTSAKKVRVVFEDSTDFFGRIVIYSLQFS
uniref:Uncharacterized protein n=1 Tax=Cuerna arida TaxID=1464854 RepID=A0A1B6EUG1_9HEMI